MARIRTVKPDFFSDEDVTSLSPLARLLFIGTWLEADREGRLRWKPLTLKTRYLPNDACDIHVVCLELIACGLVVLYGNGFAYIPGFTKHQAINPREAKSELPEPPLEVVAARVQDASLRVPHAPSLPSPSIPFPSNGESRGGAALVMSPAEWNRQREFCAFVGSRLRVPKALHGEMRSLLGGQNPDENLMAWYEELNEEIETSNESIAPDVFRWLKARYAKRMKASADDPVALAKAAYKRQMAARAK